MVQLNNNSVLSSGKYRIEKLLGQGGFGITYKAIMKETVSGSLGNMEVDVPVAIKEFFMKDTCEREEGTGKITVPSQGSRAVVELYRKKFVKEAKNLAQMNHPHIVKVVDVFEENDTVYYVMQYLSGGSLADYVKLHGALDEAIAIKYIQQIGSALEYMHQKHICHYDVKPSNILLDDKGGAMLIDFGISKGYTEEGHQTSSTPVGISTGYAPLEQYQQSLQDFSPATDVYGLAATLFYLLTGKNPPEASIVLNEGIGDKPIGISDTVWHAIEQGMNPRKKDRVQTVEAFLKLLGGQDCMKEENKEDTLYFENSKEDEQTVIVGASNSVIEENDEIEAEDDKKRSLRKVGLLVLAVIMLWGIYCIRQCQMEEATEKKLYEEAVEQAKQKAKSQEEGGQKELKQLDLLDESQGSGYDVVEEMPSFPGGQIALMSYLNSHIEYPVVAQENGVQGRVIISFVVEADGRIDEAEVARSVDPSLDREALRVVKSMPKWIPGKQNGECVRVRYSVPVVFRLE